jgi:hypothetical protein
MIAMFIKNNRNTSINTFDVWLPEIIYINACKENFKRSRQIL